MGTELPHGKGHSSSPFFYCDETAGWIRMPLGTEVGLAIDASASSIAFFDPGASPSAGP